MVDDRVVVEAADEGYRAGGARGIDGTEPGRVLQRAVDAVARDGGGAVVASVGDAFLETPVTVRPGVEFSTAPGTTLFNDLGDPGAPLVEFGRDAGTDRLFVDAQDGRGVVFGSHGTETGTYGNVVEVMSENVEHPAIELRGYYHRFGHLNTLHGSEGIRLDGAADAFVRSAIAVHAETGARFDGASAVRVGSLDVDSPREIGVQADGCYDLSLDGTVWYNRDVYPEPPAWIAAVFGRWSEAAPNALLDVDLRIARTGGRAAYLGHNAASAFEFAVTNRPHPGVDAPALTGGIELTEATTESTLSGLVTGDVPDRLTGTAADSVRVDLHRP